MSRVSDFPTSAGVGSTGTPAKELAFVIKALLAKVRTSTPVEVVAVTNDGGLSPIGYVDLKPLVGQLDGSGNVVDHGVIYDAPYMRIQGGANAVILDPQVGDIGLASFSDRDITAVKAAKKASPPGSQRRHSMSDAVYLGTIIGDAPTQYVRFSAEGIEMVSPIKIKTIAPLLEHEGNLLVTGNAAFVGTMTNNTVDIGSTHRHSGVQSGPDFSGVPI